MRVPFALPDQARLFLQPGDESARSKLLELLRQTEMSPSEKVPGVWVMPATADEVRGLMCACATNLTEAQLQSTRSFLVPAGTEPSISDYMNSECLGRLIEQIDAEWITELLSGGNLVTYFQPILPVANPSDVFGYECLTRGLAKDESVITPDRLFNAARGTGQLALLDETAPMTAIETASRLDLDTMIFINFSPASSSETMHSLQRTLRAILASDISPDRFVFEVVESEKIDDLEGLMYSLDCFRDLGSRVALDDLGSGYSSLNLLSQIKPDFVKLDIGLARNIDCDSYKSRIAETILQLCRDLDVRTVLEGVETPGEWRWAQASRVDYVQGFLFAQPEADPPQPRLLDSQGEPYQTSAETGETDEPMAMAPVLRNS
jgi:EAL domain-containing protein (putative c-di-GMP-specific phosphodiesterase class I)